MKKIFTIWFLTILFVNTSCEKWFAPKESSPSIGQILAKEITTTSATVEVTIDAIGISKTTDFGFCYSTNKDAKITDNKISLGTVYSASKAQTFTSKLSQLKTGTTYYVNVYASNKKTTIYGKAEINFNTLSLTPPKVSISDATDVKFNSFNISGQITDLGTSSVSEFGHTLSETIKEPTTADLVTKLGSANSAPKDFKSAFTSLKASTTYYVRSYAINSTGTSYSDVKTIKTSALELSKVTTETFSNITFNSAKISGRISEQGTNPVTDLGHVLSKSNQIPTTSDTKTSLGAQSIFPKDFISSFSGLEANVTYYCRAYAISEAGIAYGEVKSFKTLNLQPPTVTTISVVANSTSTGTLQGKINALGTATSITDYGFCYSITNQEPTIADTKKGLGTTTNGSLDFKTGIDNLKVNTLYYVRAYATSKDGIAYGEVKSFKTLNLQPPTVTTISAIANSISTATAQGKINALGTATSITDYGFCYSITNQEPTISDTKKGLGTTTNGNLDFKSGIDNLKANTTYYIRAYALSQDGVGYGEVKSFKTLNEVPPTISAIQMLSDKRCEFDFKTFNTTPVYNDPCDPYNYVSNGLRDGFKFGFSFQKNTNGEVISKAGIEIISNVFERGIGFSPGKFKQVVNKVESGGIGSLKTSSNFVAYLDISIATGNTKSVDCGPKPIVNNDGGINLGSSRNYGIQTAKEFKTENFFIYPYQNSQLILAKQSTKFKFMPYVITSSGKVYYGAEVEIDPIEYDCRGPGRQ